MKIGFFTESYLPSHDGVATSVAGSAKELQKLGHEVYIVAPSHPHYKDKKNVYRIFSLQVLDTTDIRFGLDFPQPSMIKILSIQFDIIHGHSGGPISLLGWDIARLRRIPFVETYHTMWKSYTHYFPFPFMLKPWIFKRISGILGNDCDALIAPTEKVKHELKRYGVKKPIFVVPSGIDTHEFRKGNKEYLHTTLHIPKNKKILLTIGRLEREKSVDFLIKMFASSMYLIEHCVLVIVGEGRDKETLEELARSYNISKSVYFAGTFPYHDMPSIYASSEIFVFASHTETQGLVIVEALASAIPVVAVEDTVFNGVVENDKNGFLVLKECETFSHKLEKILRDATLHKRFSHHAVESSKKFSVQSAALALEQVYATLLERPASKVSNV